MKGLSAHELLGTAAPKPKGATAIRPLGDDDDSEGDQMPRGHYERKKKNELSPPPAASEATPPGTGKKTRKARAKKAAVTPSQRGPRFGVFDDGSVRISTPDCTGELSREEAGSLLGFIQHLNRPA